MMNTALKTNAKHGLKALSAALLLVTSSQAVAGLSLNVGAMNDYYFRGVDQGVKTASLMGGADYAADNGLYVGVWAAQLNDGELEYDLYTGYEGEVGFLSYGVGYTGYFYTESGATEFHELNLTAGYGPLSVEYSVGTEDKDSGAEQDYDFLALTAEYQGFYLTYGDFGKDYDGDEYLEAGYGFSYEGLDFNLAAVKPNNNANSSNQVLFSISKTFDF